MRDGRRDQLERQLADSGIASAVYYRVPLHRLEPFACDDPLPESDRAAEEVLSLPIGPYQPEAVTARVLDVVVGGA